MGPTSQANARAPRVASREARRQQLVEATIASIAELGLTDTTLATVTGRAGLSHGTVNFHFQSKERLFSETLRFLAEEHREHWRSALDAAGPRPEQQLAAMIGADFDPAISSEARLSVWFAFWGERKCRPLYAEICGLMDAERLETFERLCRRIAEDGGYSRTDPALVAHGLQAQIDGVWLNMLCEPEVYAGDRAVEICLSYLAGAFPDHFAPTGAATEE